MLNLQLLETIAQLHVYHIGVCYYTLNVQRIYTSLHWKKIYLTKKRYVFSKLILDSMVDSEYMNRASCKWCIIHVCRWPKWTRSNGVDSAKTSTNSAFSGIQIISHTDSIPVHDAFTSVVFLKYPELIFFELELEDTLNLVKFGTLYWPQTQSWI